MSTKQIWAHPGQTWCIGEHKTNWDPIDRHTDEVHWQAQETDLDPSGRHKRRGALVSTKEVGTQQVDTKNKVHQ